MDNQTMPKSAKIFVIKLDSSPGLAKQFVRIEPSLLAAELTSHSDRSKWVAAGDDCRWLRIYSPV